MWRSLAVDMIDDTATQRSLCEHSPQGIQLGQLQAPAWVSSHGGEACFQVATTQPSTTQDGKILVYGTLVIALKGSTRRRDLVLQAASLASTVNK